MPGMIVAPEPLAVEAGAQVLMAGGNAIDAAVTCAFVEGIVNPMNCGIGGYMLATLHLADAPGGTGQTIALDAPTLAGSRTTPDMWEAASLGPNPEGWGFLVRDRVNYMGYSSICTPGAVRGLATLLARYGTISWADAIAPAARIAREGFMVGQTLAASWRYRARDPLTVHLPGLHRGQRRGAAYLSTGERRAPRTCGHASQPGLCRHAGAIGGARLGRLLHRRAGERDRPRSGGERQLRHGARPGRVCDARYPPLTGTYRGWEVRTSPPPHGGPTLLAALNILEGYDLGALGHNSAEYIYQVSMALKAAFADRNPYLGDPEFVDVPIDWMISKERGAEWRQHIAAGRPIMVDYVPPEPPDTTHVSVVDRHGNCVALTHSLGSGSGVDHAGLGLHLQQLDVQLQPAAGHGQLDRTAARAAPPAWRLRSSIATASRCW